MIEVRQVPPGGLEKVRDNIANLPQWLPQVMASATHVLGPIAVRVMQESMWQHIYTGTLIDSISAEYSEQDATVTISPKAMRGGRWDAGLLLELGVPRPIPRAPWAPIKAWADFRGIPAFPVWWKIRTEGVSAHPFIDRAFEAVLPYVDDAVDQVMASAIERLLDGLGEA